MCSYIYNIDDAAARRFDVVILTIALLFCSTKLLLISIDYGIFVPRYALILCLAFDPDAKDSSDVLWYLERNGFFSCFETAVLIYCAFKARVATYHYLSRIKRLPVILHCLITRTLFLRSTSTRDTLILNEFIKPYFDEGVFNHCIHILKGTPTATQIGVITDYFHSSSQYMSKKHSAVIREVATSSKFSNNSSAMLLRIAEIIEK
jgi:hypothetical protein